MSLPYFKDKNQKTLFDMGCECGICGHHSQVECDKCECCSNFHKRSGKK